MNTIFLQFSALAKQKKTLAKFPASLHRVPPGHKEGIFAKLDTYSTAKKDICYENVGNDEFNIYKNLWEKNIIRYKRNENPTGFIKKNDTSSTVENIDMNDLNYSEIFWNNTADRMEDGRSEKK